MTRIGCFLLLCLGLTLGAAPGPPPAIAIQPLGAVDPAIVEAVSARLQQTFACTTTILPPAPLPKGAFYPPRNRYRGTLILDELAATTAPRFSKVLGITSKDISVTKGDIYDWGVFGVAYLSQRPAVISTFRLGRHGASKALLLRRILNVAVHEAGHTFGLDHCATPHCIMEDAGGTIRSVDSSSDRFCERCRAILGPLLRAP